MTRVIRDAVPKRCDSFVTKARLAGTSVKVANTQEADITIQERRVFRTSSSTKREASIEHSGNRDALSSIDQNSSIQRFSLSGRMERS